MPNLPVHWSEGMFLRPHHFQAADRYWSESLSQSDGWDHAYHYGIRRLKISTDAIANSHFQVDHCESRLMDGTLVSLGVGQQPDRVDMREDLANLTSALKPLKADLTADLSSSPTIRVYLAVPKLKLGVKNVSLEGGGGLQRFVAVDQSIQDESTGGNDQEIQLKSLTVRLLLSTQDTTGFEVLPIAQIQRAGEGAAVPQLDDQYIPPLLAIEAWPGLAKDFFRDIYDLIGKKSELLSEQVLANNISFASQSPVDLDRIQMLHVLNEAYATLGVLSFADGLHPLPAYAELCRIIGRLSVFGKSRRAPEVPAYDHDDLHRIFRWAKKQIEDLLKEVKEPVYEQHPFVGAGLGMQVALKHKWLLPGWKWYVGVSYKNITDKECRELLAPGQSNWKLGSQRQVEDIFIRGKAGLFLVPVGRTPESLPASRNWDFYEVSRDNAAWADVQSDETLAMRFTDTSIVNRDALEGAQQLIVNYRGRRAELEFALFAVRIMA